MDGNVVKLSNFDMYDYDDHYDPYDIYDMRQNDI